MCDAMGLVSTPMYMHTPMHRLLLCQYREDQKKRSKRTPGPRTSPFLLCQNKVVRLLDTDVLGFPERGQTYKNSSGMDRTQDLESEDGVEFQLQHLITVGIWAIL